MHMQRTAIRCAQICRLAKVRNRPEPKLDVRFVSSLELNPVENVWQFLRDNWLSNRIFKSYDDLVDHCCHTWNKLVEQPRRIMSIGLRQ
jgi:putative transposase